MRRRAGCCRAISIYFPRNDLKVAGAAARGIGKDSRLQNPGPKLPVTETQPECRFHITGKLHVVIAGG